MYAKRKRKIRFQETRLFVNRTLTCPPSRLFQSAFRETLSTAPVQAKTIYRLYKIIHRQRRSMGDANLGERKRTHLMASHNISRVSSAQAINKAVPAWNRKSSSGRLTRRVKSAPTTSNAFIEAVQEPKGDKFIFLPVVWDSASRPTPFEIAKHAQHRSSKGALEEDSKKALEQDFYQSTVIERDRARIIHRRCA